MNDLKTKGFYFILPMWDNIQQLRKYFILHQKSWMDKREGPREREMDFTELREAIEEMELMDAHAHIIVTLEPTFPFISGFSKANGNTFNLASHSLSSTPTTFFRLFTM